ncbi:MAG: CDP-alcohol phosphatidyltransferase family protein [Candidatus Aenigmarchaeota archaeon]|nr:CDP-alcohol phosphatidyltransferase family protein [Candidatus Aenigmarchaeota archaeon]
MIADSKDYVESFLVPVAKRLNVNPNIITLLAIIFMFLCGYEIFLSNIVLGALFLFISGFLDLLDGTVAKFHKTTSKFGMFFDRVGDRISDFVLIFSTFLGGYVSAVIAFTTIFFVYMASYESSVIESGTKSKVGEKLSMRAVRLSVMFFGLLFSQVYYAVLIVLLIGIYSFFERFYHAWRYL